MEVYAATDDAADGVRTGHFDARHARAVMRELARSPTAMDATAFAGVTEEIRNLVLDLGGVFSFAASEIRDKLAVVRARAAEMRSETGAPVVTVQALVAWEVARHTERRHEHTDASAARSVLRLMWLFDFVHELLAILLPAANAAEPAAAAAAAGHAVTVAHAPADPPSERSLGACARAAYAETLAQHHPALLRQAVYAATLLLPSRGTFLRLLEDGRPHEELEPALRDFVSALSVVRDALWAFFRERGLLSLP